jgi:restriction system protein
MENNYSVLMSPWHERKHEDEFIEALRVEVVPQYFPQTFPQSMVVAAHKKMMVDLSGELLGYIYAQSHGFFESLVIDVILALGYGGGRRDLAHRIGRCGDGGIDGIIEMDELGLDVIYLQAKRLKLGSSVPISAVRDFIGSLESKHATKGIFVTTAHYTPATIALVETISKKVVLIDGLRLTELMVRNNIGILPTETLQFKKVDVSYFCESRLTAGGVNTNSASIQPRR